MSIVIEPRESYPIPEGFHEFRVIKIEPWRNGIDVHWSCVHCGAKRYRSIRVKSGQCVEVTV